MDKTILTTLLGLAICAAMLLSGCKDSEQKTQAIEIYLVRHFQKQTALSSSNTDVALTEQGRANANTLSQHLISKDIQKIYSTDYQRTKQTAMPISEAIKVPLTLYDPRDLTSFAQQVLVNKQNQLVVGHSNTTGQLFGLLGCESVSLTEQDYGDIFVVKVSIDNAKRVLECSRYQLPNTFKDDLVWVKQSDLHQYWHQINKQFSFRGPDSTEPKQSGWVEIGFSIDAQGLATEYEIVDSDPSDLWHSEAMLAVKQLRFEKAFSDQITPNIYTTWIFRFNAS